MQRTMRIDTTTRACAAVVLTSTFRACYKTRSTTESAPWPATTKAYERGPYVNKAELVEAVAKAADISKAAAERAVNGALGAITTSLRRGQSVTLVGFGTFSVGRRAARTGRNPRTGDAIKIRASKVPKFRAGKELKSAVN
jgi:DNA-binding protein HU-beta